MDDELTAVAQRTLPRSRAGLAGRVADLARPVQVVSGALTVGQLERLFRDPALTCLGVHDDDDPWRLGLLTRARFTGAMTGRLGYGRAVLERQPTATIADWSPLVVGADASVAEVATLAMNRPGERRYDEVLVQAEHWCVASAADLVHALVAALADRSTHDPLTRLSARATT